MANSKNPMFSESVLNRSSSATEQISGAMTINGTIQKSIILLVILMASAFVSWRVGVDPKLAGIMKPFLYGSGFIGLGLVFWMSFKPHVSPMVAPFYALVEGVFVGIISATYAQVFDGIVFNAVMLTMFVLLSMLVLYGLRIIKVTQRLRSIVMTATLGILLTYLVSWGLSFIGVHIPIIFGNGWMGIGFSLFVVGLAAFNLLLDFDFIEKGAAGNYPKFMEWFGAVGLIVTLIWLYLEILRLLSKISSRG